MGNQPSVEFFLLGIACFVALVFTFQADRAYWIPILVYLGAYLITSCYGATWIAATDGQVLNRIFFVKTYGLELEGTFRYMYVLLVPFLVPAIFLFFFQKAINRSRFVERFMSTLDIEMPLWLFLVELFIVGGAVIGALLMTGFLSYDAIFSEPDYQQQIVERHQIANAFPGLFFGIIYGGLPTLAACAIHRAAKTRRLTWIVTALATVLTTLMAILACRSSGTLLVFLLALLLAFWQSGFIKGWVAGAVGLAGLVVILVTVRGLADSRVVVFLLFRMASAFPYYVELYPEHVGMPVDAIAKDVLPIMYGRTAEVIGNAPAPAHVVSFAQGGYAYCTLAIFVIAFLAGMSGKLSLGQHSPVRFAVFIQSLISMYYFTQVSIYEGVLSIYGISFGLLVMFPAILFSWRQKRNGQDEKLPDER